MAAMQIETFDGRGSNHWQAISCHGPQTISGVQHAQWRQTWRQSERPVSKLSSRAIVLSDLSADVVHRKERGVVRDTEV